MSATSLININNTHKYESFKRRRPLKTPGLWLSQSINHLQEANNQPGKNSDYNGPGVLAENMSVWDDFVTAQDIQSQLNDTTLYRLGRAFTENQLEQFTWGQPKSGLNINEQSFERAWAPIIHGINLILQIVSIANIDEKDSPAYVIIGDGDVAKRKAPEYAATNFDAKRKKVDFASYGALSRERFREIGPDAVFNRVPGDAKIYRKLRHSMLPPNGKEFIKNKTTQVEAMKVLKQIYNYMDQHEARYGYVVNNEEIVFFRREPGDWGHMKISPPIKHKVEADLARGILNSKYVLFYFLHVIASDEEKWRLKSCLPTLKDKYSQTSAQTKKRNRREIAMNQVA